MDANVEMLNYIYQNAQMGENTLEQLMKISKDENFKKLLGSQFSEYKKIFNEAQQKLTALNKEAKDLSAGRKVMTYIMINFETLKDSSPSHISQMLIQGSTMGIIAITKNLKEYKDANQDIIALGHKLLEFEQQNVEECKKFL